MWTIVWASVGWAAPSVEFSRVAEVPRVARYQRVDGRPARARGKGPRGPVEAAVWRDGTVAWDRRWDGRRLVEERRYDAMGDRWATLRYEEGEVRGVVVHGRTDADVAVDTWATVAYGAVELRLPPVTHRTDGTLQVTLPSGRELRAAWLPAESPFEETFEQGLYEGCACEIVDRYTVFADGRAGAGFLTSRQSAEGPILGELWAFQDPQGLLVLTATAPTGLEPVGVDDPAVRLAAGRAMVALAKWRGDEDADRR